jgi:tetratricopeptide (TPR) repeat protein
MGCTHASRTLALARGDLTPEEADAAAVHGAECATCAALLAGMLAAGATAESAADPNVPFTGTLSVPPPIGALRSQSGHERVESPSDLATGARVGRYVVLRKLGAGGMGAVYAAFDPELDRKVALKVLYRVSGASDSQGTGGRAWLLRESQALARLAHPNVVTIFDVGTFDDQVFMAMELVDGPTLGAWLKAEARTPREILETFIAAGQGLAAAHAKGLVHRDFKPDNVLVGNDGRVRVTDFGLARPASADASESPLPWAETPTAVVDHLHASLTRVGSVVGTPAYMAPEQYAGQPAAARSDQFSFCVALYRGLWGQHPFVDVGTRPSPADFVVGFRKPPREPPRTRVSARLRAAIRRGLSVEPDGRHATMAALLEVLSTQPLLTAPRLAVGALLGGLLATSTLLWVNSRPAVRCEEVRSQLAGVWDDGVSARVEAAFLNTGLGYAPDTFRRTKTALQAYADSWVQRQRTVCEAAREGSPSALMEREALCLARRRGQLAALTALLAKAPDRGLVNRAVQAAWGLESLEVCGDARALLRGMAPPQDPLLRERVSTLESQVAAVEALYATGKYQEGLRRGEALRAEVETLGWEPLLARVLLLAAGLQELAGDFPGAEERLRTLIPLAAKVGEDRVVLEAWRMLLVVVGTRQARVPEALALRLSLDEALARVDEVRARARAGIAVGLVLNRAGRFDEAQRVAAESVAALERAFGPDEPSLAGALNGLGNALNDAGHSKEALASHQRALALRERTLGPEHPEVGISANNLGNSLRDVGRLAEAEAFFQRAVRIATASAGEDSPMADAFAGNLGMALVDLGRVEEGMALHAHVLALREKRLGAVHPDVATVLLSLGSGARSMNRLDASKAYVERALSILQATSGADHLATSSAWLELGLTETRLGRFDRARPAIAQAQAIREKTLSPESPMVAECVAALADVQRRSGRLGEALELFQRAIPHLDGMERGWNQFLEAKLSWQLGRDRPRALALAAQAHQACEQAGQAPRAAEISRWMKAPTAP